MSARELPLLFIRHAVAEDSHVLGDEARALTPEGRAAFRHHARKLARLTPLRGIITSPLVRAVQTAELLAEAFGVSGVEVHPALLPQRGAHKRIVDLGRERGAGWALVGHNPSLERAAIRALEQELPDKLRKGAALALHPLKNGGFTLAWWATPGKPVKRPGDLR
ncbi:MULTISPECIES: SixA phosphatase family protein [Myxococcus]|uniref:Histidine phosphatase n=1 Tax=Myxococcus xanthus TaxID=34 RepID=A0AAE6G318_MYXXA|nr:MULTISPECIES: phosphoglycerate mutase family protein [Myxococcus]QDE69734.1 histidine phosphatase [Myxococcus xanthus]QDE77013.1 histidine phosphatase [Myxococcus xanthus]QDE84404.1 histidine phosphatase [Myxococcus xanthus]QDE98571.1 histidine phosphatase [Myxococcus xanthus]QDF06277.1 histidine phosphatase [Myxococcus xanthus]